jgi:diguanylate cyclase (GGDEF)-like protein
MSSLNNTGIGAGKMQLVKSEIPYRDLIENLADGIVILDGKGIVRYMNPVAEHLLQQEASSRIGRIHKDLLKLKDKKAEVEITRPGGEKIIVETRCVTGQWEDKTVFYVSLRDATHTVALREKLKHYSFYDELTDLYNRRGFFDMLERQIKLSNRKGIKFFLLFADIDGLKKINDTWGHVTGDRALQEFAAILRNCFRESDIIARIGGDEFSVFPIDADRKMCAILLKRIDRAIVEFHNKHDGPYRLAASMGTAFYDPAYPCSPDELLGRADAEMYKIKKMKKGGIDDQRR